MTQRIGWRRLWIAVTLVACSTLFLSTVAAERAEAGVVAQDRAEMLLLTNNARVERDLKRLSLDEKLSRYARRHSRAMADQDRLFHTQNLAAKLKGTSWKVGGENVGYGSSLKQIQSAFMKSEAHRANILRKAFKYVGIGVVRSGGTFWVTVIFYG